jgi:CRP-like cAMP-binding protein
MTTLNELLEDRTAAIQQDPDNPNLRVEAGEILERMELSQEALLQYETAARLFINLALYREAAAICTRMLALDPSHREARRILQGLQRRRLADEGTSSYASPPERAQQVVVLEQRENATSAAGQDAEAAAAGDDPFGMKPVSTRELVSRSGPALDPGTDSDPDLPLPPIEAKGLFPLLPPAAAASGIQQTYASDQVILREGEMSDELFLLIEGRARVTRGDGAAALDLGTVEQGSFFGEIALLGNGRAHATVQAAEPCTVLIVPKASIRQLMRSSPEAERLLRSVYRDRLLDMVLRTSSLFATLHGRIARRFLRQFRPARHRADEVVIAEGDAPTGLFLVLVGELEVAAKGPQGRDVHLAHVSHGDFFGEVSLLRDQPCNATVTTRTFAQLLWLAPADFASFGERHPRFKAMIDEAAARREVAREQALASA